MPRALGLFHCELTTHRALLPVRHYRAAICRAPQRDGIRLGFVHVPRQRLCNPVKELYDASPICLHSSAICCKTICDSELFVSKPWMHLLYIFYEGLRPLPSPPPQNVEPSVTIAAILAALAITSLRRQRFFLVYGAASAPLPCHTRSSPLSPSRMGEHPIPTTVDSAESFPVPAATSSSGE